MNETARLMPPGIDHNRPSASPIDQKPSWSAGVQMINLSPPAGDQAALLGVNSEPLQSSSGTMSRENDDNWASDLDKSGDDISGDPEGVWSPDIEQAFQEALAIYPPCGRRKIILSDEGKMYGRNELIARYIKIRCGKTRTRKQVSSHIQVLARKKMREHTGGKSVKHESANSPPSAATQNGNSALLTQNSSATNSAGIPSNGGSPVNGQTVSTTASEAKNNHLLAPITQQAPLVPPAVTTNPGLSKEQLQIQQLSQTLFSGGFVNPFIPGMPFTNGCTPFTPPFGTFKDYLGADPNNPFYAFTPILPKAFSPPQKASNQMASSRLMLREFTAYVEGEQVTQRKEVLRITTSKDADLVDVEWNDIADSFQDKAQHLYSQAPPDGVFLVKCWADIHFNIDFETALFAVDSHYVSSQNFPTLRISTMACSFGKVAVEKIEEVPVRLVDGHFEYRLEKSPVCQWLVDFVTQLKSLETVAEMNRVLENFSVLQELRGIKEDKSEESLMVFGILFAIGDMNNIESEFFRIKA
ncbi:unnamed protein product, partial [Mesorhabditis belari]|uniref:TEA domain-containing protein n=1 Tax=Mesorhabditis belari TaxID=2138241 RepID=A0AAF3FJV0_9BILA